jgi:acetamidase/formamidase
MRLPLLQPGEGLITGDHYLPSTLESVSWGRLPVEGATPAVAMRSGETVTIDTDAADIAAGHPPRDLSVDGPHVVTGPIAVAGARPSDVVKVEFLELAPGRRMR